MALENSSEENANNKVEEKDTRDRNSNDDITEEQNIIAPPGICDICAEFYNFLVSGTILTNDFLFNEQGYGLNLCPLSSKIFLIYSN